MIAISRAPKSALARLNRRLPAGQSLQTRRATSPVRLAWARSHAYVARSLTRLTVDTLEAAAICWVASPHLAYLAMVISFALLPMRALRVTPGARGPLAIRALVGALSFGLAVSWLRARGFADEGSSWVIAARAIVLAAELIFPLSSRRTDARQFRWVAWALLPAAAATQWAPLASPVDRFRFAVCAFALLRILPSLPLTRPRFARARLVPIPARRRMVALSHLLPSTAFVLLALRSHLMWKSTVLLFAAKLLLWRLAPRALAGLAGEVDAELADRKADVARAERLLRFAVAWGLGVILAGLALGAWATSQPASLLWLGLASAVRILVSALEWGDRDLKVSPTVLAVRAAQALTFAVWGEPAICVALEAPLAARLAWAWLRRPELHARDPRKLTATLDTKPFEFRIRLLAAARGEPAIERQLKDLSATLGPRYRLHRIGSVEIGVNATIPTVSESSSQEPFERVRARLLSRHPWSVAEVIRTAAAVAWITLIMTGVPRSVQAAQPESDARARVYCDSEDGPYPVVLVVPGEAPRALVDFRFPSAPYSRTAYFCERWLEKARPLFSAAQAVPLYSPGSRPLARLAGPVRSKLHKLCRSSAECGIRFPYGWDLSLKVWKQAWKALFKPSPWSSSTGDAQGDENLARVCAMPVEEPVNAALSREAPPLLRPQDDVRTWLTTETTFADEVAKLIPPGSRGTVWAATLSLELSQLRKITKALERSPAVEVVLLHDLSAAWSGRELEAVIDAAGELGSRLHLLPVFQSPATTRYFHLKGAALPESGRWMFTSANLRSSTRTPLVDLGVSARDRETATQLAAVYAAAARGACEHAGYLECSLRARYSPGDPREAQLRSLLNSTCDTVHARGAELARDGASSPFVTPQDHDLPAVLEGFARFAKKSIVGTTHQLRAPALEAAVIGGISVGATDGKHAKLLLRDGDEVFWGTGNFTGNGLIHSIELFFRTREPKIVEAARDYLAHPGVSHPTRLPFVEMSHEETKVD